MSIKIKSKEVNYLIYKYLLEAGLQHSAFTLFNEGQLENSVQEYEQDVKAGHLIHLLERSLIFNQIEQHATMSEFCECNESMELIKKHYCQLVQKEQQKIEQEEKQVDQELFDISQRQENLKSNNLSVEENTYEIGEDYATSTFKQIEIGDKINMDNVLLTKNNQKQYLTYFNKELNLIQNIILGEVDTPITTQSILPACVGDVLVNVKKMIWDPVSESYLMVIFQDGTLIMYNEATQKISKMMKLNNIDKLVDVKWNQQYQNLVAFIYEDTIEFINPIIRQNILSIENEFQSFDWIQFDLTLTLNKEGNKIDIKGLQDDTFDYSISVLDNSENIKINSKKSFIGIFNKVENIIKIYTLQDPINPLYIQDEDQIVDYHWGFDNSVTVIFKQKIKVFDGELASHKYTVMFVEDIIFADTIQGPNGSFLILFTRNEMTLVDIKNQTRHKQVLSSQPQNIQKLSEDDIGYKINNKYIIINLQKANI